MASPIYDIDIINSLGESAAIGEKGEIVVKGNRNQLGLLLEYYNDKERTDKVFTSLGYHTGDIGWKDENGYYWYEGRIDDIIKSSGYRIGPFEVESAI